MQILSNRGPTTVPPVGNRCASRFATSACAGRTLFAAAQSAVRRLSAWFARARTRRQAVEGSPVAGRASGVILAVALAVGFALRLQMYLLDRSLWLDTAALALNIVDRGYAALFGPLGVGQMAPVGFLVASKFVGSLFGYSEMSLTLLPFLFSVTALALFLRLSIDALGLVRAPLAFVPFAACSTAIYYAGEFKQYASDLFFSVLILWIAYRALRERRTMRWALAFGMAGVVSVWFSHTAICMLAGAGLALFLNALEEHDARRMAVLAVAGGVTAGHFLALYLLQIRPSVVQGMTETWSMGYAPVWPLTEGTLGWWIRRLTGYPEYPLGFHGFAARLALPALAVGLGFACGDRPRRAVVYLLFFPMAVLVVLSVLHAYPLMTGHYDINARFVLFTVPVGFILLAKGIDGVASLFPRPVLIGTGLVVLMVGTAVHHVRGLPGSMRQEMRPLVAYLYENEAPGDAVYVYKHAIPAFRFYTRNRAIPFDVGTTVVPGELPSDLSRVIGGKRIWAVISHDYANNHEIIKRELEVRHGRVFSKAFPGAWLLLSLPDRTLR